MRRNQTRPSRHVHSQVECAHLRSGDEACVKKQPMCFNRQWSTEKQHGLRSFTSQITSEILEQFALPSARAAAVWIDETQLAAWRKRGYHFARYSKPDS